MMEALGHASPVKKAKIQTERLPVADALTRRNMHDKLDIHRGRCGARIKQRRPFKAADGWSPDTPRCRKNAEPNGRCRLHGGLSTGAVTDEGKARSVAAMVEGRRKWIERLHAEGKRAPGGRPRKTALNRERRRLKAEKEDRRKRTVEVNRVKASARTTEKVEKARRYTIKQAMAREQSAVSEQEKATARLETMKAIYPPDVLAELLAPALAQPAPMHVISEAQRRVLAMPPKQRPLSYCPQFAAVRILVIGRDRKYRWRCGSY